jgi:hypothetical protein
MAKLTEALGIEAKAETKAVGTKSLGAYIASGSTASLAEVGSALSGLTQDNKKRLQAIFASPPKVNTLSEVVALWSRANAAETEATLASFSPSVIAKLKEAVAIDAKSETKAVGTNSLGAYIASGSTASLAEVGSALSALTQDNKKRLQAIFASPPKTTTMAEIATLAASTTTSDAAPILADLSAAVKKKLSDALISLGTDVPKTIASSSTLPEMASLLASVSDADTEAALTNFSPSVMAKLTEALGIDAETRAARANFSPDVQVTDALGDFRSLSRPVWGDLHAMFPERRSLNV